MILINDFVEFQILGVLIDSMKLVSNCFLEKINEVQKNFEEICKDSNMFCEFFALLCILEGNLSEQIHGKFGIVQNTITVQKKRSKFGNPKFDKN